MTENEDMEEEVGSESYIVLEENDEGKCDTYHEERTFFPIEYLCSRKVAVMVSTLWNHSSFRGGRSDLELVENTLSIIASGRV